jgi:phosphatidylserine/phosphatidylglycerophosphate/cardiolipin synthase-like enzyme
MFIRVQRTTLLLLLIAVLCIAPRICWGVDSPAALRALVGDPNDTAYCRAVLEAIAGACDTIDVLVSSTSITDNPILPALAEAAGRGVAIRALLDASEWEPDITAKNLPTLSYLLEYGIDAKFDDPAVTLHAKLVIVDRETVILGSSNWNRYALTEHKQADVWVQEASVGAFYTDYFEILWSGPSPAQAVELVLPNDFGEQTALLPLADLPDTASYGNTLLQLLAQAKQSIHVAMYRMSIYSGYADSLANDLLYALADAANRGLDVKVLLDDCAFYEDSAEANLMSAIVLQQRGVEVRLDDPGVTTHCKLIVIDGETIALGSTNWNYYSLEKNYEIDLMMVCLPSVAASFEAFFQSLWDSGRGLAP